MQNIKKRPLLACILASLGSIATLSWAQVDRAAVTGTLHDSSGALVTEAKVTVTFPATGLKRTTLSNGSGAFLIAGLPVGHVQVQAEKQGFRTIRAEVDLGVGETKTLDFAFEIATTETTVEVAAEADLARTSAAVGATFDNTQISQLPINGRNWGGLMTLTPGAVDTGAGNGASVRFFGQDGDDNNYRIDSMNATSVRNQTGSKSRLMISKNAIAEFRVNSQLYTAETGGATGGQIKIA